MGSTSIKLNKKPSNTASNGLTEVGNDIRLGGTLIQNTDINQNGFNLTTSGLGNVGLGISIPTAKLHVFNSSGNTGLFKSTNGSTINYAVRGETVNGGAALDVYGELGVFDGSRWNGVRGNSGTALAASISGINTVANGLSGYFNERVGIGTSSPAVRLSVQDPSGNIARFGWNATEYIQLVSGGVESRIESSLARPMRFTVNGTSRISILSTGEIGLNTLTPTSSIHKEGSVAETVTVITASITLNNTHNKIVVNNGATAITVTLPNALTCLGRKYEFSRYAGSTGTVNITPSVGQIQAFNGTVGATTTIGGHSAAGAGLRHSFTAVNIAGVGTWVRI